MTVNVEAIKADDPPAPRKIEDRLKLLSDTERSAVLEVLSDVERYMEPAVVARKLTGWGFPLSSSTVNRWRAANIPDVGTA